jgi:hypothetical protein
MNSSKFTDISMLSKGVSSLIKALRKGEYITEPSPKIASLIHEDMPMDLCKMLETMAHVPNASICIGDWYIESRCVFSAKRILRTVDFDEDKETAVVIGSNLGTMVLVAAWDADESQTSVYAINDDYRIASFLGTLDEFAKPLVKKNKR